MSRPLRIEFPDAWYHVMNRGRRGDLIFKERGDHYAFIDLLKDCTEMWNMRVVAYCLMGTHYHILLQTPDGNLSRCMRHIDGVYTQYFNRSHGLDGHLFRGRYKSIFVDSDSYLLELLRYIHRNPVEAGIAKRLDSYQWSSHKGFLSGSEKTIYLMRNLTGKKLGEIGGEFGINNYSSVSTIIERTKQKAATDGKFRKRIEKVRWDLMVSQKQTWPVFKNIECFRAEKAFFLRENFCSIKGSAETASVAF